MSYSDAAWETEPNAFAELLEVPDTCEATVCVCPQGRDYENTQYTLIRCDTCGSHCVHNKCLLTKQPFTCGACVLPVPEVPRPEEPNPEANNQSIHNCSTDVDQPLSDSLKSNVGSQETADSDSESDGFPLSRHKCRVVKWNNILTTPSNKRRSKESSSSANSSPNNNNNSIKEGVSLSKNISAASDVEFVETKEEVMCISDDEGDTLGSVSHVAAVSYAKKRALDEVESPPIRPPNKKVRRALETMRNQSKITSFFTQLGKGVLGITG